MKLSRHLVFILGELGGGDAKFATERIEVLAAQYSQDGVDY